MEYLLSKGGQIKFHIRKDISLSFILQIMYDICRKGDVLMAEADLRELSIDFAVQAVKLCEKSKGHYGSVNQLERSATGTLPT